MRAGGRHSPRSWRTRLRQGSNDAWVTHHIFEESLEVASGLPWVQLPVFGAEQLAAPDAVKAGGQHGVHPFLERDTAAAGPDVSAALLEVAAAAKGVQGIAKIDAEDQVLVHPGDFLR